LSTNFDIFFLEVRDYINRTSHSGLDLLFGS